MGEIADALKRARLQRGGRSSEASEAEAPERPERSDGEPALHEVSRGAPDGHSHEIPRDKDDLWVPRAVLVEAQQPVAQRFRHLAVRVRRELQRRDPPILLVTSAGSNEGKTTTACNLALALASISPRHRVALLELDLRRPTLAHALEIKEPPGLERVFTGELRLRDVRVATEFESFDVYPVRSPTPRAHELFSSVSAASLFRELARHYSFVVCDTPPVLPVPDVALLAEHAGAWLSVVRSGVTRRAAFREMMEGLPREKLIGTFLNQAPGSRSTSHYYDYYEEEVQ